MNDNVLKFPCRDPLIVFGFVQEAARAGMALGIDPEMLASSFITRALILVYGISEDRAFELTKHCITYSCEYLQREEIKRRETNGEDPNGVLRNVYDEMRAQRPAWMKLDHDAVAAAEEKRPSGLLGSTASWTPPKRCDDDQG